MSDWKTWLNKREKKAIAEKWEETIIKQYLKYSLVYIIDEIGYLPIYKETSYVFFLLIEDRYEKRFII